MRTQTRFWSAVLALMVLPLLQGCGDDLTGPNDDMIRRGGNGGVSADQLVLSPGKLNLRVGQQVQMTVRQGDRQIATHDVAWSSSDIRVAWVSDEGLVEAMANGAVTITARYGGMIDHAAVTVGATGVDSRIIEGEEEQR